MVSKHGWTTAGKFVPPREWARTGGRKQVQIPFGLVIGLPWIVLLVIAVIGLRMLGIRIW